MDLVEFQGKQLFGRNGVPVPPEGSVCRTVDEIVAAAEEHLGEEPRPSSSRRRSRPVVAARPAGVKLATSVEEAREHAESILGLDIKGTPSTSSTSSPPRHRGGVLPVGDARPGQQGPPRHLLPGGRRRHRGGQPHQPGRGRQASLARRGRRRPAARHATRVVTAANLPEEVRAAAAELLVKLFAAYRAEDATLAEINPLIRTDDDRVIALDAKVSLDGSAAFRHDGYAEWQIDGSRPTIRWRPRRRPRGSSTSSSTGRSACSATVPGS
jgi:succinyl-CoA synthetase beta subunit